MEKARPGRITGRAPRIQKKCTGLKYFISGQVLVRLGELCKLRLIVEIWFRDLERTSLIRGIGFNVDNTFDFFQIASDRGGTTPSRHVRYFEAHQCKLTLIG